MTQSRKLVSGACLVFALCSAAFGHAISIGYENAGPGSVRVWLGTYSIGHLYALEGSLNLVGALGNSFPSTTVEFNLLTPIGVANKPAGLIDGVTNFYADWGSVPNNLPLVNSETPFNIGCPGCGPVNHWQGVTFNGLGPGSYQFTYVPIPEPSHEWALWSTNMNGIFDLTGVVNPTGVPDGGYTLALLGGSLAAMAGISRRRRALFRAQAGPAARLRAAD